MVKNNVKRRMEPPMIWKNIGGTFDPCETAINPESGLYVEPGDIIDPLQRKNDPANMDRDQYFLKLIPFGSSEYYKRKAKGMKQSKAPKLTGCAVKNKKQPLRKITDVKKFSILRRNNCVINRIAV